MATLEVVIYPFMFLNAFGVFIGAIWLAITLKWNVLGVGLLGMIIGVPVVGIATLPSTLIGFAAAPL